MVLWRSFITLGLLTAALVLAACGSSGSTSAPELPPLAAMESMPPEVQSAAYEVALAYRYAAVAPDILKQIPCYCGCAPMGHDSNYACFWTDDGELEPHGLNCGICIFTARDTWEGLQQERTLAEIRAQIDADYSRFGPSTDTPPVSATHE